MSFFDISRNKYIGSQTPAQDLFFIKDGSQVRFQEIFFARDRPLKD